MATKIDYVALFKPLEKILKSEDMTLEARNKMAIAIIEDVLKQAEEKQ